MRNAAFDSCKDLRCIQTHSVALLVRQVISPIHQFCFYCADLFFHFLKVATKISTPTSTYWPNWSGRVEHRLKHAKRFLVIHLPAIPCRARGKQSLDKWSDRADMGIDACAVDVADVIVVRQKWAPPLWNTLWEKAVDECRSLSYFSCVGYFESQLKRKEP